MTTVSFYVILGVWHPYYSGRASSRLVRHALGVYVVAGGGAPTRRAARPSPAALGTCRPNMPADKIASGLTRSTRVFFTRSAATASAVLTARSRTIPATKEGSGVSVAVAVALPAQCARLHHLARPQIVRDPLLPPPLLLLERLKHQRRSQLTDLATLADLAMRWRLSQAKPSPRRVLGQDGWYQVEVGPGAGSRPALGAASRAAATAWKAASSLLHRGW